MKIITDQDCMGSARSLCRAISIHLGITPGILLANARPPVFDESEVLVLNVHGQLSLENWIWGKIRAKHKNPLIVLGFWDQVDFGKGQPAFNGVGDEALASKSHCYLQIPFLLSDFSARAVALISVEDLDLINEFYSNQKKYLWHRIHGIQAPNPQKDWDLNKTKARLTEVIEYFRSKGEAGKARNISEGLWALAGKDWPTKAYELRRVCESYLV